MQGGISLEKKKINILISSEEISNRIKELGRQISKDYEGKSVYVLSLLRGSFIYTADLVRELEVPTQIGFMTTSSYGHNETSSGTVQVVHDIDRKSTRLNSSHANISYAVFCLKKKKIIIKITHIHYKQLTISY